MPKTFTLRLGTRASNLALTQSRLIAQALKKAHRGLRIKLVEISTTGDEVRDRPLQSFGGAGVFVKELECALLDKRIDLAVHSLKDMPTRQPRGLVLGAIVGREDPRDVAVLAGGKRLEDLPAGSVIGTGSLRRRAQLKARFPQLEFAEIRGNVETRLRKVAEGSYAGTILARAGLARLGLLNESMEVLSYNIMLPAPGQGALGLECRKSDARTLKLLKPLHCKDVAACVSAERAVLEALGSGCHLPLAALGELEERDGKRTLHVSAVFGLPDASACVHSEAWAAPSQARKLGLQVAASILARGGKEILEALGSN